MSVVSDNRTTATQMINRMKDPQLPEEELRRTMKTFLVQYANHIFVKLPEKKQKAAALMAYAAIDANPMIMRCDPASIIKSVAEAALYDLTIGGITAHAYLIPYGKEAKLQIGYKGLIELCRRSGEIKDILVEDVRPGDRFDVTFGDDPRIEHTPAFDAERAGRPVSHVYAVIRLRDGGVVRRVFSATEIDQNKEKYSKGWAKGEAYRLDCIRAKQPINPQRLSPWHTAWLPMAKKTVLRAMINGGLVPIATEVREAMRDDDDMPIDGVATSVAPNLVPQLADILPQSALAIEESPQAHEDATQQVTAAQQAAPAVEAVTSQQVAPGSSPVATEAAAPEHKPNNALAFQAYVDTLEKLDMVREAEGLYLTTFAPSSETPWAPEEDALGKQLCDARCKAIKAVRGPRKQ